MNRKKTMNGLSGLPPPKPIPLKDRASIAFVEKGNVGVLDGAFVVVDASGVRVHLPVGGLASRFIPRKCSELSVVMHFDVDEVTEYTTLGGNVAFKTMHSYQWIGKRVSPCAGVHRTVCTFRCL